MKNHSTNIFRMMVNTIGVLMCMALLIVCAQMNPAKACEACSICGQTEETVRGTPSVNAGDILIFGQYEQDGKRKNGPEGIEWLVLDVQDDKALLLSLYALDSQPFNVDYESVTWENSTLRDWLNSTFLDTAFTASEQSAILMTEVDNSAFQGNQKWDRRGNDDTEDSVFLLSYAETNQYFDDAADRICEPTNYAIKMGADVRRLDDGATDAGWWWLRSPGEERHHAAFVNFDGTRYTNAVGNGYLSVRPALWLNLERCHIICG